MTLRLIDIAPSSFRRRLGCIQGLRNHDRIPSAQPKGRGGGHRFGLAGRARVLAAGRGAGGACLPTDSSCTDKPTPCATLRSYGQSACRLGLPFLHHGYRAWSRCSDSANQAGSLPKGISRSVDFGAMWLRLCGGHLAVPRGKVLRDNA